MPRYTFLVQEYLNLWRFSDWNIRRWKEKLMSWTVLALIRTKSFELSLVEVNILQAEEKDREEVAWGNAAPQEGEEDLGWYLSKFQERLLTSQTPGKEVGICKGQKRWELGLVKFNQGFQLLHACFASILITKRLFCNPGIKEIFVLLKALGWIVR